MFAVFLILNTSHAIKGLNIRESWFKLQVKHIFIVSVVYTKKKKTRNKAVTTLIASYVLSD